MGTDGVAVLTGLPAALGEVHWTRLRAGMERRAHAPGDVIVAQGSLDPDFHIITEGTASVVAMAQGLRREIGALGPGDAIGDMALLTGEPASADVVAATPVVTYAIAPSRLAELDDVRAPLFEALAGVLAQRLRQANARLVAQHSATAVHLTCAPHDLPAIARLPGELARVVGAPVLTVLAAQPPGIVPPEAMAGERTVVWTVADEELDALPARISRSAHEFHHILIIRPPATEAPRGINAERAYQVVRTRDEVAGATPIIALSDSAWTQPAIAGLASQLGGAVAAAIPPHSRPLAPRDPIAKLARVIAERRIGVALGAGAAKGLAHVGVLRGLDELGVDIDILAGCSIGSAIAAAWASGLNPDEIMENVTTIAARAMRPTLPIHSFLSSRGIRDELERVGKGRHFKDLNLPLAICATDLFRRCEVTYTEGLVWPRLLASMSLPGIFPAIRGPDSYLVDGGVLNPVPSRQCRELGAGVVIGVRLTAERTSPKDALDTKPGRPLATETIMRSLEIMNNRLSELSRNDADATIEVRLSRGGMRDFDRTAEFAAAGQQAVVDAREDLAKVMPYIGASA